MSQVHRGITKLMSMLIMLLFLEQLMRAEAEAGAGGARSEEDCLQNDPHVIGPVTWSTIT
jgi:hypothetical protein